MNRSLAALTTATIMVALTGGVFAQNGAPAQGATVPPATPSAPSAGVASPAPGAVAQSPGTNQAAGAQPPVAVPPSPPAAAAPAQSSAVQSTSAPGAPPIDNLNNLKTFKNQGADINYLGRKYGLDGWLISKGNNIQIVYTTLDGQGTVVGLLYGPDGNVETGTQLLEAKARGLTLPNTTANLNNTGPSSVTSAVAAVGNPAAAATAPSAPQTPSAAPAAPATGATPASERIWAEMGSSTYLTFGSPTAPVLYVFMDPECHYCHDYFTTLQALPQGTVQLRVVPVAILGTASQQAAERILSAQDPAKAWDQVEKGDSSALPATAVPDVAGKLLQNRKLMLEWKMQGTPGSIYRGKDGKVKLVYGMPDDIHQVVSDLASN